MINIKRQFIRDATGVPIGVILPIEEFVLVKEILENLNSLPAPDDDEKFNLLEQAAHDPLFLADMNEVMVAFASTDGEWWEPVE